MKTVYFKDYRNSGDDGYDLYRLMKSLKGEVGVRIVFEKDTYNIYPERASECCVCIANHGWNGFKRVAVLIEDMDSLELDFSGSTLVCHDVITHFALLRSKNITVKNVTLECPFIMFLQAKVIAHGDGYVDLEKMIGGEHFILRNNCELALQYKESLFVVDNSIEFNGETGEMEHGTADHSFGYLWNMRFEDIGDNKLRLHGVKRYPPIGNIEVFYAARRLGCGFFLEDCSDIYVENVTVHSCYGMGLLAQTSHNITLNSFNTLRHGDQYYTAMADGTHFVNCTGLVKVENSTFEGQLDDALNIHGMYTSIVEKNQNEIFVREVHSQAKGIRIYREGDRVQILRPLSLIPYTEKTIKEVEYINQDTVRLSFAEGTADITVGDDVELLDRAADLIFRNNIVRNNRARGMLIATRGKTVIEDCYFHTSGSAILFEASGDYWYESGGVLDVTIRNNNFDACKHGGWGRAVVNCVPRKEIEDGKYYNRKIKVENNSFNMISDYVVRFDNVEHAVFKNNIVEHIDGVTPKLIINHVGNAEIDSDLPIE